MEPWVSHHAKGVGLAPGPLVTVRQIPLRGWGDCLADLDRSWTPRTIARSVNICNRCLTAMASSDFKVPYQRTGFVPFAESLNGRLAMLGFVIAIATEALSGKGVLGQLGLG